MLGLRFLGVDVNVLPRHDRMVETVASLHLISWEKQPVLASFGTMNTGLTSSVHEIRYIISRV